MPAQLPEQRPDATVVCEGCPFGCVVTVSFDEAGGIAHIEGNTCGRGYEYAQNVVEGGDPSAMRPEWGASQEGASAPSGDEAKPAARGYRAFRKEHARKRQQG